MVQKKGLVSCREKEKLRRTGGSSGRTGYSEEKHCDLEPEAAAQGRQEMPLLSASGTKPNSYILSTALGRGHWKVGTWDMAIL